MDMSNQKNYKVTELTSLAEIALTQPISRSYLHKLRREGVFTAVPRDEVDFCQIKMKKNSRWWVTNTEFTKLLDIISKLRNKKHYATGVKI